MWLSKNVDKEYNLNITKYKDEQKLIRNTAKQNTDLASLTKPMKIEPADVDKDKFYNNTDKGKGDRYQQWLKGLRTDLYIDESVKIVADMSTSLSTTTVKK